MAKRAQYYYYRKINNSRKIYALTKGDLFLYKKGVFVHYVQTLDLDHPKVCIWEDIPANTSLFRCKKDGSFYNPSPEQRLARQYNQYRGQIAWAQKAIQNILKSYPDLHGQGVLMRLDLLKDSLDFAYQERKEQLKWQKNSA